jgi:hypothetical protein
VQLNVYVPKSQTDVIERLNRVAARLGRNKNDVVLEAIGEKVAQLEAGLPATRPQFKSYAIGAGVFSREQLYSERLEP